MTATATVNDWTFEVTRFRVEHPGPDRATFLSARSGTFQILELEPPNPFAAEACGTTKRIRPMRDERTAPATIAEAMAANLAATGEPDELMEFQPLLKVYVPAYSSNADRHVTRASIAAVPPLPVLTVANGGKGNYPGKRTPRPPVPPLTPEGRFALLVDAFQKGKRTPRHNPFPTARYGTAPRLRWPDGDPRRGRGLMPRKLRAARLRFVTPGTVAA